MKAPGRTLVLLVRFLSEFAAGVAYGAVVIVFAVLVRYTGEPEPSPGPRSRPRNARTARP